MGEKIVLGLSGGVDSAVAAKLLQEHYDVTGLYLDIGLGGSGAADAAAVAERLGIPLEIAVKYQGYIDRQLRQVEEQRKMEDRPLPPDLDYLSMAGLRLEARQKLDRIRPLSLGQASRISGVSPADIAVLMLQLEK